MTKPNDSPDPVSDIYEARALILAQHRKILAVKIMLRAMATELSKLADVIFEDKGADDELVND